ncbi:hypothetical protein BDQ12DRAFT_560347, partial [Crucibulum laeve]
GTSHDSYERDPAPRCHPETRRDVRSLISQWLTATPISTDNPSSRILWLHGPAGAGKSAIAQSIAQDCAQTRRLAASFFFS